MFEQLELSELLELLGRYEGGGEFLFAVSGDWEGDVDISSLQIIETKLRMEQLPTAFITKVKLLCIEMIQNVMKHRAKEHPSPPYFAVIKQEDELVIITGNVLRLEAKQLIENRLSSLKSLDAESLKRAYKEALMSNEFTPEGNVGLGFMDIAYRVDNTIYYHFEDLEEDYLGFYFKVTLKLPL